MELRHIAAAAVCIAILYGIDAWWFDGSYFGAANRALRDVYVHW